MESESPPVIAQPLDGLRILLVEDTDDSREVLKLLLETHGARVTAVASARGALDALDRVEPDVLVSDISMPEVDGYALIAEVRSRLPERGGTIPAVALTALASPEDRSRVLAAGFQAHLCKPVEFDDLITTIKALTAAC